jgi:hypothetical protein
METDTAKIRNVPKRSSRDVLTLALSVDRYYIKMVGSLPP